MKTIGERRGRNKRRGGKRKKMSPPSTSCFRLTAVGDCWKGYSLLRMMLLLGYHACAGILEYGALPASPS